jgi:hypothetical protein
VKLILFLFICTEVVLASVQHSRREVARGVITIQIDGNAVYIPQDVWEREIRRRTKAISEAKEDLFPKGMI